ncbi:MAG: hypothetical protein K0V04_45560, partial [Deltaproteobacteria bacterium]|nr:hypothetical protein [Deltaproteobacteria bacterium]
SKLARLVKALNRDVANTNSIAGSVEYERDKQYEKLVEDVESEITIALPGKVTPDDIRLPKLVREFKKKNKNEKWAKFSVNRKNFVSDCRELGEKTDAEFKRQRELQGFMSGDKFRTLNYKTRAKLVEDGKKDEAKSAATVRNELRAALDAQRKPSKARWASFLNLGSGGSYTLTQAGAYKRVPIHLTMSNDSWTSEADGGVDVSTNSVDQIFEKLLEVEGWKQLHATLEVPGVEMKNRPHLYLFAGTRGSERKWAKLQETEEWKEGAQKQMKSELSRVASSIKNKIAQAKNDDGAI